MSANGKLLTDDEMIALLDEHKQEHIYQVLPHFNAQHPIFQQVRIIIISLLLRYGAVMSWSSADEMKC